ncbi:MAG TPA: TadE/TadG family type IV pilus assembly protein, partial [Brevibacterium sp.]|nr:TadE/TadG family type IV pilus assembly protein [Brevibacterium sp.]
MSRTIGITVPPAADRRADDGSAVAEFVMVSALLTLVFAAVLQIGLAMHVRNTVVDSAIAGARVAAAADRTTADGAQHTALLISTALSSAY